MRRCPTSPLLVLLAFLAGALLPAQVAALAPTPLQAEEQESEDDQEGQDEQEEQKSYSDVITDEAITSEGLFDTHMIEEDLFYEIPLDMLDREMLLLTRIARTPDGAGYGGSKANTSTVRW
ncbi:MAG: DUF5118 domain-containing protein, partial [Gemmatimonadota bacterium]|nr:DUF5118 domain-containing protein [Gemmatimonadota bacterium]